MGLVLVERELALEDDVPGLALELDLDDGLLLAMLHEFLEVLGPSQHVGLAPKAKADGAHEGGLARAVGAEDHVQVRAGKKLGGVVGDKIGELDPHNAAGEPAITADEMRAREKKEKKFSKKSKRQAKKKKWREKKLRLTRLL